MTEVLTYEALKAKCDRLEQINAQTLQVKLTMAETIKELTDRVERLSGMLTESRVATKSAEERADALAVENAAMRNALESIRIYSSDTLSGPSDSVPDMAAWLREGVEHLHQVSTIQTPATDAALAAIREQACKALIDAFVRQVDAAGLDDSDSVTIFECRDTMKYAAEQAINPREAK